VNKVDLLTEAEAVEIEKLAGKQFPGKTIRLQNSNNSQSVAEWVTLIEAGRLPLPTQPVAMDYQRYGEGEARLAWLDEELTFQAPKGAARNFIVEFISALIETLQVEVAPIGHLKFVIRTADIHEKISFATLHEKDWIERIPLISAHQGSLLINARVEIAAERLSELVKRAGEDVARRFGVKYRLTAVDAFHPGFPNPTHRMN